MHFLLVLHLHLFYRHYFENPGAFFLGCSFLSSIPAALDSSAPGFPSPFQLFLVMLTFFLPYVPVFIFLLQFLILFSHFFIQMRFFYLPDVFGLTHSRSSSFAVTNPLLCFICILWITICLAEWQHLAESILEDIQVNISMYCIGDEADDTLTDSNNMMQSKAQGQDNHI